MSDDHNSLSGVGSGLVGLIPSLYYDLIARALPGSVLLALVGRPDKAPMAPPDLYLPDSLLGLLYVTIAGYVVGILLTPLGSLVKMLYYAIVRRLAILKGNEERSLREFAGVAIARMDRVGATRADFGTTLGKMYAESLFASNLLVGFVALCWWQPESSPLSAADVRVKLAIGLVLVGSGVQRTLSFVLRGLELQATCRTEGP